MLLHNIYLLWHHTSLKWHAPSQQYGHCTEATALVIDIVLALIIALDDSSSSTTRIPDASLCNMVSLIIVWPEHVYHETAPRKRTHCCTPRTT
jgi:hypothetical protein